MSLNSLLITQYSALLLGWGGWIRTNECRFQRPVPYHLATPQIESEFKERTNEITHRLSRAGIRSETLYHRAISANPVHIQFSRELAAEICDPQRRRIRSSHFQSTKLPRLRPQA